MFKRLFIENLRGFRTFELTGLGAVNLLVGGNNSGKTSVLEALGLLASGGDLRWVWTTMSQRGEWVEEERAGRRDLEIALRYLFHSYQLTDGQTLRIRATQDTGQEQAIELGVQIPWKSPLPPRLSRTRRAQYRSGEPGDGDVARLEGLLGGLTIRTTPGRNDEDEAPLPISESGGISTEAVLESAARSQRPAGPAVRLISTASLSAQEVVELADRVQLTPEEEYVKQALRIVEPRISDFRPTRSSGAGLYPYPVEGRSARSGVILKLEGVDVRLPIGTLGDGTWRILGLALAMASTRGGILLVDEIDTGLHYSVMEKMWRLVVDSARRLGVQVFATSHSKDCYESLAAVAKPQRREEDSFVTIHRIGAQASGSVLFGEQDIINAAKRGIEVR